MDEKLLDKIIGKIDQITKAPETDRPRKIPIPTFFILQLTPRQLSELTQESEELEEIW